MEDAPSEDAIIRSNEVDVYGPPKDLCLCCDVAHLGKEMVDHNLDEC